MRGRNRILGFLMVLSVVCLAGYAGSSQEDSQEQEDKERAEIVLKAGEVNPEDNINTQVLHYFAGQVKELSNGRIIVEIYADGQLGDEQTELQAVQMGALDIFRGNTLTIGGFGADKMGIFGLPYLFEGRDHLWDVLKSDLGRDILNSLWEAETDMMGLAYVDEGTRNFFAKKPIEKPDDLKGTKIRVTETSILLDTVSCFGASPTPISMSELYTSLQTGVVDGADQPLSEYISNSFGEIAPHVILDNHTYTPGVIIMSGYRFNRLSAGDQDIIRRATEAAEDYNREVVATGKTEQIEALRAQGIKMIEVEDFGPWRSVVQPVYDQYTVGFEDMVEQIRAMNEMWGRKNRYGR